MAQTQIIYDYLMAEAGEEGWDGEGGTKTKDIIAAFMQECASEDTPKELKLAILDPNNWEEEYDSDLAKAIYQMAVKCDEEGEDPDVDWEALFLILNEEDAVVRAGMLLGLKHKQEDICTTCDCERPGPNSNARGHCDKCAPCECDNADCTVVGGTCWAMMAEYK
jgi:hypothetical protein